MNEQFCAVCGQPMKWIGPGVSKSTGRPYNGFYACEIREHKQPKATQAVYQAPQPIYQPQQAYQAPRVANLAPQAIIQPKQTNQSDEIRANVALKMVSETLSAGVIPLTEWQIWADAWYNYIPNENKKPITQKLQEAGLTPEQEGEIDIGDNIPF